MPDNERKKEGGYRSSSWRDADRAGLFKSVFFGVEPGPVYR